MSRPTTASGVTVALPGQLRELAGGAAEVVVDDGGDAPDGGTSTVGDVFRRLRSKHPAVYDRIFTEQGRIRPHVNVFVDGADIRWAGGLEAPVRRGSEVVVLPAVSGG